MFIVLRGTARVHAGDALIVNLFIPSRLNWRDRGLSLRQENRFPDQAGTRLVFESDARLRLKLRYPAWAASKRATLRVNGEPLPVDHGFPARLVVAGLYGYVSATKWLERIELTTWDDVDGYWIPLGWSKEGPIKTQSRIERVVSGAPPGTLLGMTICPWGSS